MISYSWEGEAVECFWKENRASMPKHLWITYLSIVTQLVKKLISIQNWIVVEFCLCFVFVIAVLVFKQKSVSAEPGAWLKLHEQNCLHMYSEDIVVSCTCRLTWWVTSGFTSCLRFNHRIFPTVGLLTTCIFLIPSKAWDLVNWAWATFCLKSHINIKSISIKPS